MIRQVPVLEICCLHHIRIYSLPTGEWSVREALKNEVPFSAIAGSVFARYNSRGNDDFSAKVVQALRVEFGGHNSQERPQK